MGKEAKIGVSVILILLCGLAGVVAMRMTRSKEKSLATAIAGPEAGRPAAAADFKPAMASGPTTLVAAGGPRPSGWASTSDMGSRGTNEASSPKPPGMSYMPDPSLAGSRYSMPPSPLSTGAPWAAQGGTTLAIRPAVSMDSPLPPPVPATDNPLRTPSSVGVSLGAPGGYPRAPSEVYGSAPLAAASSPPAPQPTYASGRYGYGSPPEPGPALRSVSMPTSVLDATAAKPPVERVSPGGTYKVQPSDNYWKISEKLYGTGAYFKALAEHNRDHIGRDDRLLPGTPLDAPTVAQLEEKYPGLCPKASHQRAAGARIANVSSGGKLAGRRTYKVEAGDTLYDIAKHELGNPGRWGEIYQINRDVLGDDYDYLSPGLELVLPDSPRQDTLARNPEAPLRR